MNDATKVIFLYLLGFVVLLFLGAFAAYYFLFTRDVNDLLDYLPAGQEEYEQSIRFDEDGFPLEQPQSETPPVSQSSTNEELLGIMTELDAEFGATTPVDGELENLE